MSAITFRNMAFYNVSCVLCRNIDSIMTNSTDQCCLLHKLFNSICVYLQESSDEISQGPYNRSENGNIVCTESGNGISHSEIWERICQIKSKLKLSFGAIMF
jgi:hypothetical protein